MKQQPEHSKGGYSLVELMIALVVAAIMFSGVYMVSIQTMNILRITRDESRALQAAQYELEKLRSWSWSTIGGYATAGGYDVDPDDNAALQYLTDGAASVMMSPHVVAGIVEPVYAVTVSVTWSSFDGTEMTKTVTSLVTEKGLSQ